MWYRSFKFYFNLKLHYKLISQRLAPSIQFSVLELSRSPELMPWAPSYSQSNKNHSIYFRTIVTSGALYNCDLTLQPYSQVLWLQFHHSLLVVFVTQLLKTEGSSKAQNVYSHDKTSAELTHLELKCPVILWSLKRYIITIGGSGRIFVFCGICQKCCISVLFECPVLKVVVGAVVFSLYGFTLWTVRSIGWM